MNIHNVSLSIYLETRTPKKDGSYPVKLRVNFNRKRKYYSLNSSLTKEQFDKVFSNKPRGKEKELKMQFNEIENKADEIIKQMPDFSFDLFEKILFNKRGDKKDVYKSYENYIRILRENDQFGSADSYNQSKNSIMLFTGRKTLLFNEITPEFLTKYERWQVRNGKSVTTVGIYLRCLRKLFNEAIAEEVIKQNQYPFGRNKYQIPASKNIKKALTIAEIGQIFNYDAPKGSTEEYARDLWMFSYLCNGMNMADIARLKYKYMDEEQIIFSREKTRITSKQNSQAIIVSLVPDAIKIINKWGNEFEPSNFIFPILNADDELEYQRKQVKQLIKTVNKYMRRIAKALDINKPVTTYVARHSFSTILKNSGASTELISESLGHSNILTTKAYLDSFDKGFKKKYMDKLTAFKDDD